MVHLQRVQRRAQLHRVRTLIMVKISEQELGKLDSAASLRDAALAEARRQADRAWHAEHVLCIALQERQAAIDETAKLQVELEKVRAAQKKRK